MVYTASLQKRMISKQVTIPRAQKFWPTPGSAPTIGVFRPVKVSCGQIKNALSSCGERDYNIFRVKSP